MFDPLVRLWRRMATTHEVPPTKETATVYKTFFVPGFGMVEMPAVSGTPSECERFIASMQCANPGEHYHVVRT